MLGAEQRPEAGREAGCSLFADRSWWSLSVGSGLMGQAEREDSEDEEEDSVWSGIRAQVRDQDVKK